MNVAAAGTTVKAPTRKRFWGLGRRRHAEHGVSFPELVWLHHLRQEELRKRGHEPYEGPAEQRYRRYLHWFEEEHGKIVDSYWCINDASGVALTVKRRPLMFPARAVVAMRHCHPSTHRARAVAAMHRYRRPTRR